MWIIISAMFLAILLGLFVLIPRGRKSKSGQVKQVSNQEKVIKSYSKEEVALHNKRSDCWIIVKDKVYDVTSSVEDHPGGDSILNHAGDDSTEGFFGPQHSSRAFDMIGDFYIGDLQK